MFINTFSLSKSSPHHRGIFSTRPLIINIRLRRILYLEPAYNYCSVHQGKRDLSRRSNIGNYPKTSIISIVLRLKPALLAGFAIYSIKDYFNPLRWIHCCDLQLIISRFILFTLTHDLGSRLFNLSLIPSSANGNRLMKF